MSKKLLADIQAQIAQLEAQAEKLRADADAEHRKVVATVIQEVRAKIAEYGLTAKDLGLSAASGKLKRKAVAPTPSVPVEAGTVYRSPTGETWTGGSRGRKPRWLTDALAEGKQLEDFAVS